MSSPVNILQFGYGKYPGGPDNSGVVIKLVKEKGIRPIIVIRYSNLQDPVPRSRILGATIIIVESINSNTLRSINLKISCYAQHFPINFDCQMTHSSHNINLGNRRSHTLGSCVNNCKWGTSTSGFGRQLSMFSHSKMEYITSRPSLNPDKLVRALVSR